MPDDARKIFQQNLKFLMNEKGISNTDICNRLGLPSATVSSWVTGKKYPRIDVMQRLADLFGVRLSTLTSEEGIKDLEDQRRLEALHQDPRLGLLFDRSRKMDSDDVDFMLKMSEKILRERDPE